MFKDKLYMSKTSMFAHYDFVEQSDLTVRKTAGFHVQEIFLLEEARKWERF